MDISTLELFVEVMRRRNFTDIARAHGVAPSSVSRSITGLEKELGIRLFQRTTRKLEPTEAGMAYLDRISSVLDDLESARLIATDLSEQPRGTLRVTASTVFGGMHLVPLLPELADQYPALSIELNLTDAYLDLIDERIDVAIRLGTLQDSSYIAKRLRKMKFYVCASPQYIKKHGQPESPERVAEHNCLLFPRAGFTLSWLFKHGDRATQNIPIGGNCLITNSDAIKQCTLYGMGLSLLPDWLVEEELASGTLLNIFPDYEVSATDFESSVWVVYPSKEYLALKSRVFIDSLFAKFSQTE